MLESEQRVLDKAATLLGSNTTNYVDQYDPDLLVTFARKDSLESSNVNIENHYTGYDVWNMYEISFLLNNGLPVHGVGKLIVPASSENIIESKSMKLYLFSFSMTKLGDTIQEATDKFITLVKTDISANVGIEVEFNFFKAPFPYIDNSFVDLGMKIEFDIFKYVDAENIEFNDYKENPELLQLKPYESYNKNLSTNTTIYSISNVKSNCRVTQQADFANVVLIINSEKTSINPESLLKYMVSFRQEFHFHEEACHMAYDRISKLVQKVDPDAEVIVLFQFTRRGGIDIVPIRSTHDSCFSKDFYFNTIVNPEIPYNKTNQQ